MSFFISESICRLARFTRVTGGIFVFYFVAGAFLLFAFLNDRSLRHYDAMPPIPWFGMVLILGAIYLIPGMAIWFMGSRLETGKGWAFWGILGMVAIDALKLAADVFVRVFAQRGVGFFVNLIPHIAMLIVAILWVSALSEVRLSHRRRTSERRGFPVNAAPRPSRIPPPPSTRLSSRKRP
ncbi:MAG TPA: hypothetical protein VFE47_01205 [Tepidisphaeraceae bacterium]|jgi:hypothetical protein|nr:hypothetical protein [Tepidisphaeraceae bacterium]